MIVINTVSSTKFSFNGITYHKNFMPFVTGNKIAILNVYDGCIFLTDAPTHFSEYIVNGVSYASVNELQEALLDVIYTRLSLSGGGGGTLNTIPRFSATGLEDSLLSQSGNQINLGTYAAFGVNNPGTPGDPGVDNDAYIGSIINNDFLIKVNNVEALRIDTLLRLKIANIQNATTDTDKFLVSDSGIVKYRTGAELLSDIGGASAGDLSGYVTLATAQTITGAKTLTSLLTGTRGSFASNGSSDTFGINHSSGSGIGLNITKGGNGEGLYINKTSGSGNAATIIGTLNATTLVKSGGTSSQFLMADGSVDSSAYITLTSLSAGTGISYNNTTGVITNSAPDQTVSLTAGAGISISGTYPSFTIASTITQYTDALARAALSFVAGSGAYNSTTGVITIPTNNNQITNGSNFITLTSLSAGAGISYNNTTGAISSTITQYTDALARAAISLTTTGTSGAATYNSTTGVLNIPNYAPDLSGYVPTSRTITINGTSFDLSANRTYSVGTVTSVGLSSSTSGVTIGSTPITTSGTITLAIATASGSQQGLLSSTDWTTFNNKQNALNGTGFVKISGTTISYDNSSYALASSLSGYLPLSGGTLTGALSGTSATFSGNIGAGGSPGTSYPLEGYLNSSTAYTTSSRGNAMRLYNTNTGSNVFAGIELGGAGGANDGLAGINGVVTGNGSSALTFYTRNSNTFSEKLRIDAPGNLGLGVTPSAWRTGQKVFQLINSALSNFEGNNTILSYNYYRDTSNNIYINTGFASSYVQISGQHQWYTAPSGTAGNAISFTQAMTLGANGNLLIGTDADTGLYRLDVNGTARFTNNIDLISAGGASGRLQSGTSAISLFTTSSADVSIGTNNLVRVIVGANGTTQFAGGIAVGGYTPSLSHAALFNGNVGIGTNSPLYKLHISEASTTGGVNLLNISTTGTQVSGNFSDLSFRLGNLGSRAAVIRAITTGNSSGNGHDLAFLTSQGGQSPAERMRIFSGGNVGIGTITDTGFKLDVNGTGRFSDTVLINKTGASTLTLGQGTTTNDYGRINFFGKGTGNGVSLMYMPIYNTQSGSTVLVSELEVAHEGSSADNKSYFSLKVHNGTSLINPLLIASTGAATFSSSVTATGFFVSSDITLKTLTQDKFDASKIDAISYKWKTDLQGKTHVGYSAQQVQQYMPDAVNTDSNGQLSVDYIQVLVQKIAHLEQKLKEHGLD